MAERWAVATGNWSATGTWNGGTLPTSSDDVHANNFTVTVDQDVTVLSLRTTAGTTPVAGGGFTVATTRTINANLIAGTTAVVTVNAGGVLTHTGTIQAGSASGAHSINVAQSSSILASHTGDVTGGSNASAHGIQYVNGAVNAQGPVTGNITGGSAGIGVNVAGGFVGPLTINGNLVSGAGVAVGIGSTAWTGTPLLTINGNITGTGTGIGLSIGATSNINITVNGKIKAGLGHGASVATTGTLTVNNVGQIAVEGTDQAGGASDYGVSLNACACIINGHIVGGSNGSVSAGISLAATIKSLTVNGDVTGGSATGAAGVITGAFFTLDFPFTFNGTVKGGTGAQAYGVSSSSSQGFIFDCIEGNAYGNGSVAQSVPGYFCSANNVNARAKKLKYGSHGSPPVWGMILLIDDAPNNLGSVPRYSDLATMVLRQTSFAADFPALSDVRLNTTFDNGAKVGSLAMPPASSVIAGALVDNTVGTGVFTAANFRDAIGMDAADLDLQLADAVTACEELQTSVDALVASVDGIEPALAGLVKQVHNFDMLSNIADTVPKISLRNAVRMGFNFSMTDTLATVYKEDGTTEAWTADVELDGKAIRELKVN